MTEAITARQMREIERRAIESGRVTGLELMERAGRGVVEAVFEEWPALGTGAHRAVVLCGPGNNGGDGFVVARLLNDAGWDVKVFLLGNRETLPTDARANLDRVTQLVRPLKDAKAALSPLPDLLIDGLFGTGLSRPIEGWLARFLAEIGEVAAPTCEVAIDIPSGLHSDTGEVLGIAFRSELTVTFHRKKHGHVLKDGPRFCGKVVVKDIGL